MRIYYFILILLTAFSFAGCNKKSDVAPQGAQGASGSQGLKKQGAISGTITGTRSDGTPINESFTYEYYDNSDESNWYDVDNQYTFTAYRRDLYESQDYIEFDANGLVYGSTAPDPSNFQFGFHFAKVLDGGLVLQFGDYQNMAKLDFSYVSSTLNLTNYSFDQNTGRLKFDYQVDFVPSENYSYKDATVKGNVDVIVAKKYQ